jgi:UDP-2-acetamido-3-amino-2,3-dideoxy-glucuronate N-acetyltransferase
MMVARNPGASGSVVAPRNDCAVHRQAFHPSASISPSAVVGARTRVWHWSQIGDQARVGDDCIVGSGVYIDREVVVGNKVKIQTGAQLYHGAVVEDGVFVGPRACLTNDRSPRAITPDGELKSDADWVLGHIRICYGASIGAGAVVLPDVTVGRFAMVAAGAVVVADVPDHGLIIGTPGRLVGYVCACGRRLRVEEGLDGRRGTCTTCGCGYVWSVTTGEWIEEKLRVDYRGR